MRIKNYNLISAFLSIFIGMSLLQGCSDLVFDEYREDKTEVIAEDGFTPVSMVVEGLGLRNPLTRSLTQEGENSTATERIRVLVFDKDDKFAYEAKVTSFVPSSDPADKKSKGTMTFLAKNTPAGNTDTFVVLANVASSEATATAALAGKTRTEVMQLFVFSLPENAAWENGRLPMWGVSSPVVVNHSSGADPKLGTVYLVRAVARVDVGLNLSSSVQGASQFDEKAGGITGISLTKVYFYNTNNNGRVVPIEDNDHWDSAARKAKQPSLPTPAPAITQKIDKSASIAGSNILLREMYMPEAVNTPEKATQGANGQTLPETDNANYMKRPYIVVGMKGADKTNPDKETFFRIDYLKRTGTEASATYEYLSLLRNHRYLVNITNVGGPGFNTEEEAKQGPAANIMYNVVVWSESTMSNVQYDGQYMLGVSNDKFVFYREGGSLTAKVQTSWPQGFTVKNLPSWITYTVQPSDPSKTGNTDEKTVTFKIDKPVTEDRTWPADPADVQNSLKAAYVEAGRMKWFLDFTQTKDINVGIAIFSDEACTLPLQFIEVNQYGQSYGKPGKVITVDGQALSAEEAGATVTFYVKTEPQNLEPNFDAEDASSRFIINKVEHLSGGVWKYTVTAPDITGDGEYFDSFSTGYDVEITHAATGKYAFAKLSVLQKEYNAIPYFDKYLHETLLVDNDNIYIMDGGEKKYYVKANCDYKIELISALSDNKVGNVIVTPFYPVVETSPSMSGLPVSFTATEDLVNPQLNHGFAKFKISSPDGYFSDREFDVELVSGIIQQEANTYMVKAGSKQGIFIPVSRVNTAYEYYKQLLEHDVTIEQGLPGLSGGATSGTVEEYLLNRLDEDDDWSVHIVWTDIKNNSGSDYIEKAGLSALFESGGTGPDSHIYVRPGNMAGNVLIEIKSGKIKGAPTLWSWHIWIVNEYPKVKTITKAGIGNPVGLGDNGDDNVRIMSHLLGAYDPVPEFTVATNNYKGDQHRQYGMQYQWGRKDPFPGAKVRGKYDFYDANGNLFDFLWVQRGDRVNLGERKPEKARGAVLTMRQSIENPKVLVSHQSFWQYENFPMADPNFFDKRWTFLYLWNKPDNGNPNSIHKTVFDPSPYGFRIMSNREAYTLRFAYYWSDRTDGLVTPLPGTIYDGSYFSDFSGGNNCIFAVCQGREKSHAGCYLLNSTGGPAGWAAASTTSNTYRRCMGFSVRPVLDPEAPNYKQYLPQ